MRSYVEELSQVAQAFISCHPNAGLPNEMGQYDLTPSMMAAKVGEFAENQVGEYRRRLLRYHAAAILPPSLTE